jgi:hypothetical protein
MAALTRLELGQVGVVLVGDEDLEAEALVVRSAIWQLAASLSGFIIR